MDCVLNPSMKEKQSGIKIAIKRLSVNALFVFTSGESFLLSSGPQNSPIVQCNITPTQSHTTYYETTTTSATRSSKSLKSSSDIVSNTAEQQI